MRITTGFKFVLPFEYWVYDVDTTVFPNAIVWTKERDDMGIISQGGGGLNLVTEQALAIGTRVERLRDAKGEPIFIVGDTEYPMYVNTSEPQFDALSRLIGWKHSLRRTPPRDYEAAFAELVENLGQ